MDTPQGITSQKGTPAEESRSRIETIPPLEAEYCGGSNVSTSAAAEHTCSLRQSLIIRHIGEQLSNLTKAMYRTLRTTLSGKIQEQ
jgi:hypothetical protein